MMTVDASAVLSIVLKEEDASTFERVLLAQPTSVMTPINYWEVLVRAGAIFGEAGVSRTEAIISRARITILPADAALAREAAAAFGRFGRRSGGRLNLGDCFAYALAVREGEGLLFKGQDFPKTDVLNALGR